MFVSFGDCGINHFIGHNFIMQMVPSISGFDSGSIAHSVPIQSRDSFVLIKLNTVLVERVC